MCITSTKQLMLFLRIAISVSCKIKCCFIFYLHEIVLEYPQFFHIFYQMLICSDRNWIAIIFVWFIYFKLSSILIHSAIKTCIITRYTNLFVNYCKNYFKFFKITWKYSMQLQLSMHTWSYTPLYFRINTREYILSIVHINLILTIHTSLLII